MTRARLSRCSERFYRPRDFLDLLAEEYCQRRDRGERPTAIEYIERRDIRELSLGLASASASAVNSDPMLALLLAREAGPDPSPEPRWGGAGSIPSLLESER